MPIEKDLHATGTVAPPNVQNIGTKWYTIHVISSYCGRVGSATRKGGRAVLRKKSWL